MTDQLKELEEWVRDEQRKLFNQIEVPMTLPSRNNVKSRVETLALVLAKIAEMRENKDV
jgi:hypothetical protein